MKIPSLDSIQAQLSPESQVALAAAGLALILLAGWLYALGPALADYSEISKRYRETIGQEVAPEVQNQMIVEAEARVASLRDDLYGSAAGVPEREREAHVLDALNRVAERRAVGLAAVTPGKATYVLMFEELPYDVRVEGPFFQLYDWLQDVERELRPMIVKSFHLEPAGDVGNVAMELRLVAYRAQQETR